MSKLWQKNYSLNKEIEKFTVGNDYLVDKKLVYFDCIASMAHAKMLNKIKILSKNELNKLVSGLKEIITLNSKGKFVIKQEDEDCHTAIENFLIQKHGIVGMKIHTARSRNDQVLTALRLYEKKEVKNIVKLLFELKESIAKTIRKNGKIKMPGYTHMQKAMPTTIGIWLGSFVSAIEDNIKLMNVCLEIIDQSPLGSGAGFDIPVLKINKKITADLMDFSKAMENPLYTQLSRGKFEASIMHALTQTMFDLNKLSTDLILFNMKEFGFVSLPKEFCTGSSIMPQKKNPDVLELIRAKYHIVLGEEFKVKSLIGNLMSGYNRDLQLTKEPLINAIEITKDSLSIMALLFNKIKINEDYCKKALTDELFATEKAYQLVKDGMPFREAYRKVGEKFR